MTELYPEGGAPKKPWQSKTLWTNAIMAGLSFFPKIAVLVSPEMVATLFVVVNTVLRFATKSKISIK